METLCTSCTSPIEYSLVDDQRNKWLPHLALLFVHYDPKSDEASS